MLSMAEAIMIRALKQLDYFSVNGSSAVLVSLECLQVVGFYELPHRIGLRNY